MREITIQATALEKGAEYLRKYADKMDKKSADIVSALLMRGEEKAREGLSEHIDTGKTISTLASYRNGLEGDISVNGNYAIWLEFGTGVAKNGPGYNHPKAQEMGMAAHGTYGKGHGADPSGWWYPVEEGLPGDWQDKDGNWHRHTTGVEATFFFYNTAQMLRREYAKIAKEAYK